MSHPRVTSPDDPALKTLCASLRRESQQADETQWPAKPLQWMGEAGVYEWFLPEHWGGQGWNETDITRGLIALSASCLTTSFVLTQRNAACTRLVASTNPRFHRDCAAGLRDGRLMTTVAISHLTTSRRHLAEPVLRATPRVGGYRLEGYSAWVTGAAYADRIVVGATLSDDRQLLVALDRQASGVVIPPAEKLVALAGSHTGRLECHGVDVPDADVLAGPMLEIMRHFGGGTGGLQTSALATGLAQAGIDYLDAEAERRGELQIAAAALRREWQSLHDDLLSLTQGSSLCTREELRSRANSLALRATQSALVAAKGSGFVATHPVGRWCREALFFLVWSCPQAVLTANLCELAMLESFD